MISLPENRKLLIAAFMIAATGLLAPLLQPINGFDTKPEKVLAGDTLYEYVAERFGGNETLTYTMFDKLPDDQDYTLLANSERGASDGDTIQTKGRYIIITHPSGEEVRIELVDDDQLATRKYIQFIQNIVVFGLLVIGGIAMCIFTSAKTKLPSAKLDTIEWARLRGIYIFWTLAVGITCMVALLIRETFFYTAILMIVFTHIVTVFVPASFIFLAILLPFWTRKRKYRTRVLVVASALVGVYSVFWYFVMQFIIIRLDLL